MTREAIDEYLDKYHPDASDWNREEAIYWFASWYHKGQWCGLYKTLSTSPFNPGPMAQGPESEEAEYLLRALVNQLS